MAGAEKLLGKGDMLSLTGDSTKPVRIQGSFITEEEVKKVVAFITARNKSTETLEESVERSEAGGVDFDSISMDSDYDDNLYPEAKKIVIESGKASSSLLQRRLRVGYARAARLIDLLEENGIVGPGDGAKPREVLISKEEEI